MTSAFGPLLESMTRERGVRAGLIVSESDGLVVDATLRVGQNGDRIAALAASAYRKARRSARAAQLGTVAFLELDAELGLVCAAGAANDLIVVVVAEPAANVGLLRMALLKAAGTIQ